MIFYLTNRIIPVISFNCSKVPCLYNVHICLFFYSTLTIELRISFTDGIHTFLINPLIMRISRVGVANGDGSNDEESEDEEKEELPRLRMKWPKSVMKSRPAAMALTSDNLASPGSRASPLLSSSPDRNHSTSVVHAPWFAAVMAVACLSVVCVIVLLVSI